MLGRWHGPVPRPGELGGTVRPPSRAVTPRGSPMGAVPGGFNPFLATLLPASPSPPAAERLLRRQGTARRICSTNE